MILSLNLYFAGTGIGDISGKMWRSYWETENLNDGMFVYHRRKSNTWASEKRDSVVQKFD